MVTYENLTQTLIPNTIMRKMLIDGVHKGYSIQPIENYVLHDNVMDYPYQDPETMEETLKFGYSPSSVYKSCSANYDFTPHTVTDENGNIYTAYGNRDFFSIPEHIKGEERNV